MKRRSNARRREDDRLFSVARAAIDRLRVAAATAVACASVVIFTPATAGATALDRARPPFAATANEMVACSATRNVCVHAPRAVATARVADALAAAENAMLTLEALALPRPLPDLGRGGSPDFDVYLDPERAAPTVGRDDAGFDVVFERATAFLAVAPDDAAGCRGRHHVASGIAQAGLLGLDAATDPATLSLAGEAFATIAAPCSTLEIEAIDTFQRAPDRTLTGDGVVAQPGSFLFSHFLDARYGTGVPGRIAAALIAIGGQHAAKAPVDEPDPFDALRATQKSRGGSLGDTMLDFAVDRAFLGSRDDDAHLPDVAYLGDLGRPRIEWSVKYASLPRRLAPARAVESLGATYVWLDLDGAPADAEITAVLEWEPPVLFRWTLVKIGKDGSEKGRVDVAPVFGEYRQERSMRDLADLAGVLVVGVNEGEASRKDPFDPGGPWIGPRSYLLTLYGKVP